MGSKPLFVKANKIQSSKKLFFFHHAGGSASQYLQAFNQIELPVEFWLLDLPGRILTGDQTPFHDFDELHRVLLSYFDHQVSGAEVSLLGHSMGGLLVASLIQVLEQKSHLKLMSFGISAIESPGLKLRSKKITHLPDPDFLKEIEKAQSLPDIVKANPALLGVALATLRNDFKVIESFHLKSGYFKTQSSGFLFGGDNDPLVSEDDLADWEQWFSFTQGPVLFPGDHFYLFHHLQKVLEKLL